MRTRWGSWVLGLAVCLPVLAGAQEAPKPAASTTLNVGLTVTEGNSKTRQLNAALVTEGEKEGLGSLRAGAEANYGQSTVNDVKDTTINNAHGFAGLKKTLSKMTFASLNAEVLHDDVADVQYRITVGPGLGFYLVKTDKTALSFDAGPSYVWEKVEGASDNYLAVRFAERLSVAVSATAKLWESVEYLPRADDFGDCLVNGEIGAEAAMTTRLNLRIVLQDKFDSTPAPGLEKSDINLVAGVGVKL